MAMKKTSLLLLPVIILAACNSNRNIPDVSNIKVNTDVERFDEAFFGIDTNVLDNSLNDVNRKFPEFLTAYLQTIVGVTDTSGIKTFFRLHKPVFDSSQKIYKDFDPVKKQLEDGFRYIKYYFPSYRLPARIIPIVGPMNSIEDMAKMSNGDFTPIFIGPDFVGISLQFYLGNNFSLYHDEYFINKVAPLYRSRRFTKEYIAADVMKVVADDIFPDKSKTKPLIEQMIEKGKQWWLIDKFLPEIADSVKTGYTQKQLNWCLENEGLIWGYIIKNENLYTVEPSTIQTFIGEGPFTQGFSQEDSPGNLGPWIGWQIVKKYEESNTGLKPEEMMQASAKQILEQAKYKPK
jgi:hypothetical protein